MTNTSRLLAYNKKRASNARLLVDDPEQYPELVIESLIGTHEVNQAHGPVLTVVETHEDGSIEMRFYQDKRFTGEAK